MCLRSLGIDIRGPLEDPEVARWLLEPAVDEVTPLQPHDASKKKRKTPLPPPPRAPRESLSLDRWVLYRRGGLRSDGFLLDLAIYIFSFFVFCFTADGGFRFNMWIL